MQTESQRPTATDYGQILQPGEQTLKLIINTGWGDLFSFRNSPGCRQQDRTVRGFSISSL